MAEYDLIGSGETARRLGFSQQYLSRLAKAGRIPFKTTPYGRVYDPADVERLRVEREARPPHGLGVYRANLRAS